MAKKLVVKTNNPETILELMHELGTSFWCQAGKDEYQVVYFATNREIHFEGPLAKDQLEQVQKESREVTSIRINEIAGEIIIQEA